MAKKKPDLQQEVENLTKKLFQLMEVEADLKVELQGDEERLVVRVRVETKGETGLLIGRRGETLMAIESFLAMALRQKMGEWVRVAVDIGDWRQKQEGYLIDLADQAAQRAGETGEPQYLYNLSSGERRTIHLHLTGKPGITTESHGEGRERYLEIKISEKKEKEKKKEKTEPKKQKRAKTKK